jgi:hypothetical protein
VLAAVADGPLGWAYNIGSGTGIDHTDIDAARADFGYEPRYTPLETAIENFLREGRRVGGRDG